MSVFFIYTFNHAVRVKSFQNEKREKKERERNRDGKKKKKYHQRNTSVNISWNRYR